MVESIGTRLATGTVRTVRATSETPAAAALATTPSTTLAQTGVTLAASMSAAAPVDIDRVAQIKQAIKDGRYPIMPGRIADSMIALRFEWKSNNETA